MSQDRWRVEIEEVEDFNFGTMRSAVLYDGDEALCYVGVGTEDEPFNKLQELVDAANTSVLRETTT